MPMPLCGYENAEPIQRFEERANVTKHEESKSMCVAHKKRATAE
ncbi:hypothetical protein FRUB_04404 [Fimbriiglobus ruber]|uniref:Uncharacterized protein n=1 Tax=Fimbriiglobus ruber TaxID=1908690 RepID=A0A225DXA3_9BACT|nr:hypothetical protein FRUB_04404 [Fimbriiglobus ruber]